jgi:hypothetical protein
MMIFLNKTNQIVQKCTDVMKISIPRIEQEKQLILQFEDALKENNACFGIKRVVEELFGILQSIIIIQDLDISVCVLNEPSSGIYI